MSNLFCGNFIEHFDLVFLDTDDGLKFLLLKVNVVNDLKIYKILELRALFLLLSFIFVLEVFLAFFP